MIERIVQWVFLRKQDYLQECLTLKWKQLIGSNFSTPKGIVDIALRLTDDTIHIVELETDVKSSNKLNYCIEQTARYLDLSKD